MPSSLQGRGSARMLLFGGTERGTPDAEESMERIRGVILDVDGTLVDSNDVHARAWVEALAEFGRPVAYEKVRKLIGMGGDKLLPAAAGIEESSAEGKKISKRRRELFKTR